MKQLLLGLFLFLVYTSTKAQTNYYYNGVGLLNQVSSWGTNTNGSGTNPPNFTNDNQIFHVVNNANADLSDPLNGISWTISGNNSKIIIGDGTNHNRLGIGDGGTFNLGTGASMDIMPRSVFYSGGGTINFNNRPVTLISSANGTGAITNAASSDVSFANNVTVERYISNKRAWRFLTVPLTSASAPTINASWQESGGSTSGYGTHITNGTNATNGYDGTTGNAPSLKTFTTSNTGEGGSWNNYTTPTTTGKVTDHRAWMIFVRGDRTLSLNNSSASNSTILRTTGALVGGNQSYTIPGPSTALYSVGANPFVCPVPVTASRTKNYFLVWDPKLGSVGGWVSINLTTGNPSNTGGSYTNAAGDYRKIEPGQAFLIECTSDEFGGHLDFSFENQDPWTNNTNQNAFRGSTTASQLLIRLGWNNTDGTVTTADGISMRFDESYSDSITIDDVKKLNNFNQNLAIHKNDGKELMEEFRKMNTTADTIKLRMWSITSGTYRLDMEPINFNTNTLAFLEDAFTNTSTPLSLTTTTTYNFSITADVASQNENRFRIVFRESSTLPVSFTGIKAYQKNTAIQVEWNVSNESAIANYEVEKSVDGRNFSKAGSVVANGSTAYNWLDATPVQGNNYYRVKSIGISGEVKCTSVVNVKLGKGGAGVTVYPNPVKDNKIALLLNDLAKGSYTVTLYNTAGQVMVTKIVEHNGGSASEQITLLTLSKGLYQLEVKGGETKSVQTIMIQ